MEGQIMIYEGLQPIMKEILWYLQTCFDLDAANEAAFVMPKDVGVAKIPHPPGAVFIGSGGLGGGGRAAGITAAGFGNLLRRLALASGRTMRKEALPL